MNHKRTRPKKQRAGCLFCKPHKGNGVGADKDPPRERRKIQPDANPPTFTITTHRPRPEFETPWVLAPDSHGELAS